MPGLSGRFTMKVSPDVAGKLLSDPERLSSCLPGVSGCERQNERVVCRVRLDTAGIDSGYLTKLSGKMSIEGPLQAMP
ncbi:hypothetical protein [Thermogymnomonas acidicola]|uniref:SRPBCC domain-containing protein n=1 Tax=Thermogymnomonas acidicola TaxID=399579 RepID=UPI0009462B7E|nr:SRPBCC domain-containing protein [Thermogymnomonas acidicola]